MTSLLARVETTRDLTDKEEETLCARRDRWPHPFSECGGSSLRLAKMLWCFCFDGERDEYLVAGVRMMDPATRRSAA
jgi:hypothetical protein